MERIIDEDAKANARKMRQETTARCSVGIRKAISELSSLYRVTKLPVKKIVKRLMRSTIEYEKIEN